MAAPEVNSPEWWLRRLHGRILARRPALRKLSNYYDGRHNLAFSSEKFLDAFGGLFRAFADNWCGLVVDAVEERMTINGFRIEQDGGGDGTSPAEQDAWRIWQQNELDAQSQTVHTETLISGFGYGTVWYGDNDDTPEITVEHAHAAIVECDPKHRRRRRAGLRLYCDEWGFEHAELFLPDGVYLFKSKTKRDSDVTSDASRVHWVADDSIPGAIDGGGFAFMPNPLGVVPMVEFKNKPRLWVPSDHYAELHAHSEIGSVIPLQDAVNKILADMLVAAEFAAYPQRFVTGYEPERDPKTDQQIPPDFRPTHNLWFTEDTEARFGSFPVADLGNFVKAIETVIQHIASITRTPPHYLNASADRLSGESIKAAETGLVAKTRRKQQHNGEQWEEIIRLAGKITGNAALAAAESAETIWADPESRTESEHVDAVIKKKAVGIPDELLWEELGMTPANIARARAMQADTQLLAPEPTPVGVPSVVAP